jgi:hypothetical protein
VGPGWLRELTAPEGKDPRRTDERRSSAQVSASLRHLCGVRSSLANIDLAETAGAVVFTNKCGRNIQAEPRTQAAWRCCRLAAIVAFPAQNRMTGAAGGAHAPAEMTAPRTTVTGPGAAGAFPVPRLEEGAFRRFCCCRPRRDGRDKSAPGGAARRIGHSAHGI